MSNDPNTTNVVIPAEDEKQLQEDIFVFEKLSAESDIASNSKNNPSQEKTDETDERSKQIEQLMNQISVQNQYIQDLTSQLVQTQAQYTNQLQQVEQNLLHQFETKIQYDRSKDQQIDKLHNELQKYKADLLLKAAKPLYVGMIRIFDDVSKKLDLLSADVSLNQTTITELEIIKTDIIYLLEENDIFPYQMDSVTFLPDAQTVAKRIPTQDQELIGKIHKSSLPGFKLNQQILIKERVYVYSQVV
jgi:molecular chaperone GrpE